MRALLTSLLLLLSVACGEVRTTDPRFATPERTVATLFSAYGVAQLSQDEIRTRMGERGAFPLRDRETWRACFADLDRPGGEAMAGYVLGLLAAAREELRYETAGDMGAVLVRERRVVLRRDAGGAYRIVLGESVPETVRRGLLQVEERARRRPPPPGP